MRQRTLRFRRTITPERITEMSRSIATNLQSLPEYSRAKVLAAYAALPDEVQTSAVVEGAFRDGKRVVLPAVEAVTDEMAFYELHAASDLSPGKFGVSEPPRKGPRVPLHATDAVLVPLVAWDERGNRIGYGKGYFDRVLADRGDSVAIGLAFEAQLVPSIPTRPTDVPLDVVVTERRVMRFSHERFW